MNMPSCSLRLSPRLSRRSFAAPRLFRACPKKCKFSTGYLAGLLGTRLEPEGNSNTIFTVALKGQGGDYDLADPETSSVLGKAWATPRGVI